MCYPDWKPPSFQPNDLVDPEHLDRMINKNYFKADNPWCDLHDETGEIKLPVNDKGILIIDPVSRFRITDAYLEHWANITHKLWIEQTIRDATTAGDKSTSDWLHDLLDNVLEDWKEVRHKCFVIRNEERLKRGLSDWNTYVDWLHGPDGPVAVVHREAVHNERSDKTDSDSSPSPSPTQSTSVLSELNPTVPSLQTHSNQISPQHHEADENTPTIPGVEDESDSVYCCGCCTS